MSGWLLIGAWKPYALLTAIIAPLAMAVPDAATVFTVAGIVGPALGIVYGGFYIASRTKIAPFERQMAKEKAEFDQKLENAKAEHDRENAKLRAETEAECFRLLDGARKESNQSLIEQQAARLGHQDERIRANELAIGDLEKKLETSESRYDTLDAEFLEFARLVIVRHGHSPDDPDEPR